MLNLGMTDVYFPLACPMELPVELFLALRYLRPRRTFVSSSPCFRSSRDPGVGALIVVLSVMAGFNTAHRKIIGFNAISRWP